MLVGSGVWAAVGAPGPSARLLAQDSKSEKRLPPEKQPRQMGTLVLIGGHEDKTGHMEILREVVRLAGGKDARMVIATTASEKPEENAEDYTHVFGKLGVRDVRVLKAPDRDSVDCAENLQAVERATCGFFTGGDQQQLVKRLRNTELDRRLHQKLLDGLVISGSGAGASMQAELMTDGGESENCARAETITLGYGMDFMPGVIADQHFSQRGRLGRLLSALALRPQSIGVGLDEDTALIVTGGDHGEVIGEGAVTIIDTANMEYNNLKGRPRGDAVALFGMTMNVLPRGCEYDFRLRKATDQNDPKNPKNPKKKEQ